MRFGIEIDGEMLDLYPKTKFTCELRSTAYFGGDEAVYNSSFVSTQAVPPTGRNLRLLLHPERIDSADVFIQDKPCVFWWRGVDLFRGHVSVRSFLTVYMTVELNPVLAKTQLQNIDIGTMDLGANPLQTATDTLQNPESYPGVFCPILNPRTVPEQGYSWYGNDIPIYQNEWDGETEDKLRFTGGISPQLRLQFVLDAIFKSTNYRLSNHWLTTPELRRLLVYNNAQLYPDASGIVAPIDLSSLMPKQTGGAFLKSVARPYNLMLDTDTINKTCDLLTMPQVLGEVPRHDWTKKAIEAPIREQDDGKLPRSFGFKHEADWMPDTAKDYRKPTNALGIDDPATPDDERSPDGFYTNSTTGIRYYHHNIGKVPGLTVSALVMRECRDRTGSLGTNTEGVSFEISPLLGAKMYGANVHPYGSESFGVSVNAPHGGNLSVNTAPTKLFFFRGFRTNELGYRYPFGSSEIVDYNGVRVQVGEGATAFDAQHDIKWTGDTGIFNRYWREWYEVLARNERIKAKFALTPNDVRTFRFSHKIRLNNINCLAKNITLSLSEESEFAEADVDLIRTF
jgi:hypothetical protein